MNRKRRKAELALGAEARGAALPRAISKFSRAALLAGVAASAVVTPALILSGGLARAQTAGAGGASGGGTAGGTPDGG
ncbi:MAG TPA: hypothetical protein VIJ04_19500, partial [Xanthobacteraceae bacterium]